MKHNAAFRKLRLRQLERSLAPFEPVRHAQRPRLGWVSAIREGRGVTLRELADDLGITPQGVLKLQKSEANESITLKRLSDIARALDCELVYALVPKTGKLTDVQSERSRSRAAERVRAAEHTMVLENQAAGNVEQRIVEEQETDSAK
jgi:predicted DNA-binding mobile mystery protein A